MADIGEVKAKVSIEYNGEGIKQAKEDLASLAEMGGSVGESAGKASEGLAGLDEQMASNAERARGFSSVLSELPKMVEGGTPAIVEMTDALREQQPALEEAGTAYESYSENMQKASKSLKDGVESANLQNENLNTVAQMWADPAPFEMLQQHLQTTGQSWADFSASVGEDRVAQIEALRSLSEGSYPLLDTMSSKVEATSTTFAKSAENMQVLNEVVGNSGESFNTITSSAHEADQAVSEFLGNRKGFSAFADSAQTADQAVAEFLGKTKEGINEFGGVGEALYGPMEGMKPVSLGGAFSEVMGGITGVLNNIAMPLMAVQMIGMAVQQVGQAMYDSAAIAEGPAAHSFGSFTGTVDALGQSLQRTSGQFSEGFGKEFLPTLNALNNQAGSSDGGWLGQLAGGIASTITNLTMITTGVNPWGGTQGLINQGAEVMGLPQPFQGPPPTTKYQQYMSAMPQTIRDATTQTQEQANLLMEEAVDPEFLAQQQQLQAAQTIYQRAQQDYNIRHPVNLAKMKADAQYNLYAQQQAENYQYQMNNQPSIWQQMGGEIGDFFSGMGSGGGYLNTPAGSLMFGALAPASLLGSIASNGGIGGWLSGLTTPTGDILSGIFGGHSPTLGDMWGGIGNMFGGIGKSISDIWTAPNGGADTLGMLFDPKAWGFGQPAQSSTTLAGGCFVAGTPVLLADGTEKPIEALRVDDVVLAHDGKEQVSATIIGCIMFPAKQTYKLIFSNGNVLHTTDSHPIATPQGWKSISPESTKQENPGLPVATLEVGDSIYTADGTLCRLVSIKTDEVAPVFNITVDAAHTYYANGILVHNAKASTIGQQASEQIGDIQLPHMDLSGMAGQLAGNFSGIQLPHMDLSSMSAGLGGAFSGIPLPHLDLSGLTAGLGSAFSGISLPHLDLSGLTAGLGSAFSGISLPSIPNIGAQISSSLGSMFSGISMPSLPDIGGTISGALSGMFGGITIPSVPDIGGMVSGAMSGMFGGIKPPEPPDVGAMISGAMSGMFGGIQVPSPPDLGGMINSAMSGMFSGISIPSVPFFAEGVRGFSGGAAVVGEAGSEIAEYNGQYALFDQGATFVNLPAGTSVYPLQDMNSYSSPRMLADGTGSGGFTPISIGGGGGAMPQSLNLHLQIGDAVISQIGIPLAQNMRLTAGYRGY